MAKLIVARGQIHHGTEVVASRGDEYTPRNAAEEKRLLARGVLVHPPSAEKSKPRQAGKATGKDEGGSEGGDA